MNDLRNEKIERLARRLLKANRVSPGELRAIVSAPQLFDQINARIRNAQAEKSTRARFPAWSLPRIGFAFGALALLLAALGLSFFPRTDFSAARLTEAVDAPEIERQAAVVDQSETDESGAPENERRENRDLAKKIALKNKSSKSARRVSNIDSKSKLSERIEPEEAFYPLAFAENLEEAKEAGQVIRVELSRSSLLALGVDPPTDNQDLKVKTDLLIGADGVARGIRFVR